MYAEPAVGLVYLSLQYFNDVNIIKPCASREEELFCGLEISWPYLAKSRQDYLLVPVS